MGAALSTIGRLVMVPLGFVLGVAAAAFSLVTLGAERVTHAVKGRGEEGDALLAIFDLVMQAHLLVSGLTIVPALALVIVGEVARIRSSLYYIVGGGLALAAVPVLARVGAGQSLALPPVTVLQVFATAGFAGGLVYWLVAGRRA